MIKLQSLHVVNQLSLQYLFKKLDISGAFVENHVSIDAWICLWSMFSFVSLCVCFYGNTMLYVYKYCVIFSFVHLAQGCSGYLEFWFFHMNFRKVFFLLLWRMPLVVWLGLHWAINCFEYYGYFKQYWFFQFLNTDEFPSFKSSILSFINGLWFSLLEVFHFFDKFCCFS